MKISQQTMRWVVAMLSIAIANVPAIIRADDWAQYAGNEQRAATARLSPPNLSALLWTAATDALGQSVTFEGPSSPVFFDGALFACARILSGTNHAGNRVIAIDAADGSVRWETPIAKAYSNSWSSPAVDIARGRILIGSGTTVYAMDAVSGEIEWATPLQRNIVNASVAVAADLVRGRAFITDFDGGGTAGSLYCLNTSDYEPIANPFEPGDIVWRETLGGSSGNTPAISNGIVYCASITGPDSPGFPDVGRIAAFDIHADEDHRRLWSTAVGEGFFGGVTARYGFVYAASYDSFGAQNNSLLVKLRADDGQVIWTTACERTDSIPIIDEDRIYLSGGLPGFGSAPKVQAFRDFGDHAELVWDTYADTAGALAVGGWTHQPVLADGRLYCGRIPTGNAFFGPYTDLFVFDLAHAPGEPQFIIDHRIGFGSSPAIVNGRLYSIGAGGLFAVAARGDYCAHEAGNNGSTIADGLIDGADLQCFVEALLSSDPSATMIALGDFDDDDALTELDAMELVQRLLGDG